MKKANTVLRWVHLLFGLAIAGYFFFLPAGGYSDAVNNVYGGVIFVVVWSGIIKWQLPRISRWRARRRIEQAGASA